MSRLVERDRLTLDSRGIDHSVPDGTIAVLQPVDHDPVGVEAHQSALFGVRQLRRLLIAYEEELSGGHSTDAAYVSVKDLTISDQEYDVTALILQPSPKAREAVALANRRPANGEGGDD